MLLCLQSQVWRNEGYAVMSQDTSAFRLELSLALQNNHKVLLATALMGRHGRTAGKKWANLYGPTQNFKVIDPSVSKNILFFTHIQHIWVN